MAFNERQWNRLLTEIEDRQVVPVIGPELLVIESSGERMSLSRHLAQTLAERLDLDCSSLPSAFDLNELVSHYLRVPGNDVEDLYFGVRELMGRKSWKSPTPLLQLAELTHFDLYLSVTFDSLLEQALNEVRCGGDSRTRCLANSRLSAPMDLPSEYKPSYSQADATPTEPAIYHLFGRLSPLKDYALRDEDVVQFCYRLQSRDLRPQNLCDFLRVRSLLLLGCAFPGWLTRFFLAAAKGDQLFSDGARGVIADSSSSHDLSLVLFLERRKTSVYSQGDAAAFVDELSLRCRQRLGDEPAQGSPQKSAEELPGFKPDSIFISYAREDRSAAEKIRKSLEAAGFNVWFDQSRLEPGQAFRDTILRNIEQCSFFIPVVSKHTAVSDRRFFFLEWNKAVDEAQFRPSDFPFIQPIAIDDTAPDAPHVPNLFRDKHWQRFDRGALPEEFCQSIQKHIRDRRRERRAV